MKKIVTFAVIGILVFLSNQSFGSHWKATNLTTTYNLGTTQIDPTGYYWAKDNKYHIFYAEGSQFSARIWELKNGTKYDITRKARAPYAQYGIHAYTWDVDNTQHVVFARYGRIFEIYGGGTLYPTWWYKNDLTSSSGGAPSAWKYVFGYVSSNDNSQRIIYYCKSNSHGNTVILDIVNKFGY